MVREEVYNSALSYFNGNELQANVWVDKYCLRDKTGEYLESTPDDMFHRLAKEFARIEQKYVNPLSYEEIYRLFKDFTYVIPGGSILYGCGNNDTFTSLGNCFVIGDSTDSYGSICKIDEEQAQLMKRRGGVGHDISHLRPKNSLVNNAAITSTGAVSFMQRYSNTTREVAQGGRRGALMLTMSVDHPDIIEFIESKSDLTKLTGCNISVKLTDEFMQAVKDDKNFALHFTSMSNGTAVGQIKIVRAKEIWDKLIHQAWATAEPGVLFWDTIVRNSPADKYEEFKSVSTNPCGEIPLCPYDTCRLMSVNLFSFVDYPFDIRATFNDTKFIEVVVKAQRLMDDVIDLEYEKINRILGKIEGKEEPDDITDCEWHLWDKIRKKLIQGRRTGLSFIGLADCLAALNIKYGSPESIAWAESISSMFRNAAYTSSEIMGKERGPFPAWDYHIDEIKRRNISLLTIPPSGSISILAGVTSGIEPVFQLEYIRRRKVEESDRIVFTDKQGDKWEEYIVYHPKYEEYGKPKAYIGSTAHDVDPISRVRMQATIQRWIDHSISSTINLPATATTDDVAKIYTTAYELGCKGVTVYREGCRDGILINEPKKVLFEQHEAPERPKVLEGDIKYAKVKGSEYCIIIGLYEGKPYELFARDNTYIWDIMQPPKGKCSIVKVGSGKYDVIVDDRNYGSITEILSDEQAAITRLISTSLRHGADIKFIVEQLNKTHGDLISFSKAIARVLKSYIVDGVQFKGISCENCGNSMVMENGCMICKSCGQSKCS